jgi:hypothetical protein
MPRYEHPDISFDVPPDWEDRSVAAFSAPIAPGQKTGPNVVLTRDKLLPGEDIGAYADRQLAELARRLDKYDLRKREEITFGGLPAVEARFSWKGGGGPVDQRLVMCVTGERLVLSLTSTAPRGTGPEVDPIMDRVLASVKIPGGRGDGAQ